MQGTKTWTWHMLAGLALVIFLGVHMIATHLDLILGWFNVKDAVGIDWANVTGRGQQVSWVVFYILFLGLALFHGMYGLKKILVEITVFQKLEKALTALFVVAGIGLFAIGAWAAVYFKMIL